MNISIFGLGYVGTVNAVCLADAGHQVIGVDVNPEKVRMINEGKSPVLEEHLEVMLAEQVRKGRLRATAVAAEAILNSEISMICVGTPSAAYGAIDLSQVEHVCKQIGTILRHSDSPHTVVIRSTMLPGSTRYMANLLSECSSRVLGNKLHMAFNPEFLREGTAIQDYYSSPYIVIGTDDQNAVTTVKEMYNFLSVPLFIVGVAESELLKYACNAFHATKIAFANEIGRLARSWGIDGYKVMEILCQDTSLNISSAYLRPGFAYGGSCLPKDLRALTWKARLSNISIPMLESLSWSNRLQIDHAYDIISQSVTDKKKIIGFLGLAFKAGTDDLRESPVVELVERLIGKGYRVYLHDENISLSRLTGANKEFIDWHIPHLLELMVEDPNKVIQSSKVLVVSKSGRQYTNALHGSTQDPIVLDLEGILSGQVRLEMTMAADNAPAHLSHSLRQPTEPRP